MLTLGTRYNKRVAECRFALNILALKTGAIENYSVNECKKLNNFYEL
jgi:galactokinase